MDSGGRKDRTIMPRPILTDRVIFPPVVGVASQARLTHDEMEFSTWISKTVIGTYYALPNDGGCEQEMMLCCGERTTLLRSKKHERSPILSASIP